MSKVRSMTLLSIVLVIFSLFLSFTPIGHNSYGHTQFKAPAHIVARGTQNQTILPSYPFRYTSFAGVVYDLNAYDGKYVRYALPDSWTQPGGLTTAQLRRLIDLTDLTYALLTEITGGEPQGPGLLTIAVIPIGTHAGLAGVSFKGIELSENQLSSVVQHIDSDLLTAETIHEMSHNFDLYTLYLDLGYSDSVHAWTQFLIPFLQYYSRAGTLQTDADALFEKKITEYTLAWDSTNATWNQCVRNGNVCPNIQANNAWAGLLLRFARLHGIEALKRSFRYVRDYAATHPATGTNPTSPQTREEKNDLLVEALAAGAQQNILCEIDAWHWFATPEARNRISDKFSTPNPFCIDADGDGFNRLTNDTDDNNAQIKPTAVETTNNIDDDCNGIIDDLLLAEQADFPSTSQSAPSINIPSKIRGQVTPSDTDTIIINFSGTLPRRLRMNLQSSNTFVGFIQVQPVDLNGRTQSFSVGGGGGQIVTLPRPGLWAVTIQNSIAAASDYTLTIEDAGSQIAPVRLKVSPGTTANTFQISASTSTNHFRTPVPTSIRFWVGPSGFVQTTPVQSQVSISLPIPAGVGPFSLRAQLMNESIPVTKATLPLWVDRTTGEMSEKSADLLITADTSLPNETPSGANATYGFTITSMGPGLAQNIETNISIPSGLKAISATTTLGTTQISDGNFRLVISELGSEEAVSFSVTATNLNAQGQVTTTATITSSTIDPVVTNNTASITGLFTPPAPTPIQIQSLPTKLITAPTKSILAQGSLARVTISLPVLALADTYGEPSQMGVWPTTLAGFQVTVGSRSAEMVAVKRMVESNPTSYTIDFLIPDTAAIGDEIAVSVTHNLSITKWLAKATIKPYAPSLWAVDGTANGPVLALDAERSTTSIAGTPFPADGARRLTLFVSGAKRLVEQNNLVLRVTCPSGSRVVLPLEFAGNIPSSPGLQQLIIRIPTALAGCGQGALAIEFSEDNQTFLLIQ